MCFCAKILIYVVSHMEIVILGLCLLNFMKLFFLLVY